MCIRDRSQYRPQVLSNLINQQYQRLGGISQLGQASAAGQATQGSAISSGIAQTQADLGAILGQGALAQGNITSSMWGNIAGAAGQFAGNIDPDSFNAAFRNTFGGSGQTPQTTQSAPEIIVPTF